MPRLPLRSKKSFAKPRLPLRSKNSFAKPRLQLWSTDSYAKPRLMFWSTNSFVKPRLLLWSKNSFAKSRSCLLISNYQQRNSILQLVFWDEVFRIATHRAHLPRRYSLLDRSSRVAFLRYSLIGEQNPSLFPKRWCHCLGLSLFLFFV
jgi:hypothetical protein